MIQSRISILLMLYISGGVGNRYAKRCKYEMVTSYPDRRFHDLWAFVRTMNALYYKFPTAVAVGAEFPHPGLFASHFGLVRKQVYNCILL
jgi:hypothetical protein